MRILIVTGSYPPDRCGVGDYTASLHRHLLDVPDVEVAVLTTFRATDETASPGAHVFRAMHGWGLGQIRDLVRVLNDWSPDIVHIQYPTQGYVGGMLPWLVPRLARLLGKCVVQTWHESYSRSSALRLLIQATVPGGLVVVRPDYQQRLHRSLHWVFHGKQLRYIRSASTLPPCTLDAHERDELKNRLLSGQRRLIVFFGFVYPHKRVELLFDIADPTTDHIVIAGEIDPADEYTTRIERLAATPPWNGKVSLLGYLPAADVTALLAVADAVILPFQWGGGDWNTSIHAATQEQAFVITTSRTASGFDPERNVYFAQPDDAQEMKAALLKYGSSPRQRAPTRSAQGWSSIAREHIELYRELLATRRPA